MNIHRYIYTRLPKDLSPTGKNGFQSAFLPGDLLSNKEVLEIESHIHFPEVTPVEDKSVVLYKQVKGEVYLILLRLRPLTEVKDEHGRGGTFLCEGFLVGEQDWRPLWNVSEVREVVDSHRFQGLEALLASPDVDRTAGKIAALDVTPRLLHVRPVQEAPAPELLMAVYHVAHTQDRDLAVILQGVPLAVSEAFQACAAFMPDALRPLVAWDDAFDGGKIFFSPLRIFGYSAVPPVTGRPVQFSAGGKEVIWPDESMRKFGQPSDPFSRWLLEVYRQPVSQSLLNALYALSQAMVSKSPTRPDMESDPVFEQVNQSDIRRLFEAGLQQLVGERWAVQLGEFVPVHAQLVSWMRGYPVQDITAFLEQAILSEGIGPERIAEAPSAKLVAQGSAVLQLLASMWTLQVPDDAVLGQLGTGDVEAALGLILRRGAHHEGQFLGALVFFRGQLAALSRCDVKIAENLRLYAEAQVPAQYSDVKQGMAMMAVEAGDFGWLVAPDSSGRSAQAVDWLRHLEEWLGVTGGDIAAWKAVRRLGKSEDISGYPVVRAFALGDGVPGGLSAEGRSGLLRALVEVHGMKEEALVELGFLEEEVQGIRAGGGLFGKIKRLFGR